MLICSSHISLSLENTCKSYYGIYLFCIPSKCCKQYRVSRWNVSKIKYNYISESNYYTHLWVTPLQRETIKVGGWSPYYFLKRGWTAVRKCNSTSHNTHWTCSCGVDIVTELAEGHKLAHARKSGMKKKTFRVFLSDDINPDRRMTVSFRNIIFMDTLFLASQSALCVTPTKVIHLLN
jgi:hypothetical protein